jgi:hypothetical protein
VPLDLILDLYPPGPIGDESWFEDQFYTDKQKPRGT